MINDEPVITTGITVYSIISVRPKRNQIINIET